jgi:hypothetical protein
LVHASEYFIGLVDDEVWALGDDVQVVVCNFRVSVSNF